MQQEIERKWLINSAGATEMKETVKYAQYEKEFTDRGGKSLEELVLTDEAITIKVKQIKQSYLLKTKDSEVRVRKVKNVTTGEISFTQTVKMGSGMVRNEDEIDIDKKTYNRLVKAAIATIEKHRISMFDEQSSTTIDIDLYESGLCTMEIEFPNEEKAETFDISHSFLGEYVEGEITGNKEYSNYRMALKASGVEE